MSATEEAVAAGQTEDNQRKEGDEQIKGMSLAVSIGGASADTSSASTTTITIAASAATSTVVAELSDPAILAVREIKFRYEREELLKLRDAPLSQRKPDFFDVNEVSSSIWDPTRWNFDRKKSDTPTEGPGGSSRPGDVSDHRRRPGDPRERIRKENDGIVLSPQRRSFNSGCFVPVRESSRANRSHSPLGGKPESSHMGAVREIQPSNRRIGSGRILRDPWDFDFDAPDSEYGGGGGGFRSQQRNNAQDSQDRRSLGRDFEKDGKDRRNGGGRFSERERRRVNDTRDEEPEWFSGGPSSQNDTIELRGFDESDKPTKKKLSPSQAKRARDWFKKKSEVASVVEEKQEDVSVEEAPGGRSTPTPQTLAADEEANGLKADKTENAGENDRVREPADAKDKKETDNSNINDQSFIFEDILKSDSIPGLPGLLTNGVGGEGDNNGKSRFTKWFSVDNNSRNESRRSSTQDDPIMKNLLKDLNETNVTIPGDSESYFAPISPAANTGGHLGNGPGTAANSKGINIMEMLQRNKQNEPGSLGVGPQKQMQGRIMNLVELEAKIRQNVVEPQMHKHAQKPEEEMAAFNRLLAQVSGGHAVTANGPVSQKAGQPMSLMEMLSHSQQQDEAHARMAHLMGPASPVASTQVPNDLASRLQQAQHKQQVDMLAKLVNANMHLHQQMRASPLAEMGVQQSRELLSRPEAQAILQGLKIGDITPQHLYQQLANPALQPRHREMLATILKLQGGGGGSGGGGIGPSPRVLSPVPPHPLFQQQQQQQQQQQLRVSPLPPNAMHNRIPSPRELQVHTQNILQRALIKKKLEEQQENYRKKQEMQQRQSPNNNTNSSNNNNAQPAKSVSSPTPLAFTPTSVLRKMTAEKDEGGKDVSKLVDGGKLNQGRAVTGMRQQGQQQPQPQQQQQSLGQWPFPLSIKQPGRPIVKANNFQQTPQEQFFSQQQQQQHKLYNQLQQQQQRKGVVGQQQQQQSQYPGSHPGGVGHLNHPQYSSANQQFSQLTQQQLRAQHQQHARPSNNPQQSQQQQQGQSQQSHMQQMGFSNQTGTAAWQQFLNPHQSRGGNHVGRGGLNDGDLSPTSNQLTRWFSSDLLERARIGELPSTPNLAQNVLSLEEIERLTAPPVHN